MHVIFLNIHDFLSRLWPALSSTVVVVFTLKARFLVKKETILRIIDLSMKKAAGQRRQRPATALLLRLVAGN